MKVTHELRFTSRCPVDDAEDEYHVIVETNRIVKVEDILRAIEELPEPAFQEQLTSELCKRLKFCKVTTIGYHSGVKTTCEA
jgi:hypothetical protein